LRDTALFTVFLEIANPNREWLRSFFLASTTKRESTER
jgi:hypothetical protein